MSIIAFIPARCGSKSIPFKNIKSFCGKPLIFWNLKELQSSNVDEIVVATDCYKIKSVVEEFNFSKVKIYDRSEENASDEATTESVILEYINQSKLSSTDIFLLTQVTSPFTQKHHFNEALELLSKYDSVLSCTIFKRFIWDNNGNPINYNYLNRIRRQELEGDLIENGAIYISKVKNIVESSNRISGNIGIYKMPEYTSVEIDEEIDWLIAEKIMQLKLPVCRDNDFSKIKIFLSDIDGVLTDGGMYYTEYGDELKRFNAHDGMAFELLRKKGIKVGVITSEKRDLNIRRARKLNLDFDFHDQKDKLLTIKALCSKEKICMSEVAYIGDDINCYDLLSNVGFPACPDNAVARIKNIPNIIRLSSRGGDGAIREFAEKILF